MPEVHIDLFGDLRIRSGDKLIAVIPQTRHQALLAYLLLHRHAPQARRHVAFLLWPDSSETQALTNLRKALTHLRQMAPILAQALYTDHKVIRWQPPFRFMPDVADFEEKIAQANVAEQVYRHDEAITLMVAAVDLYAGPLLPGCYDDWLIAERERLHQLCLKTREQLVASYERQGDFATAIHYAQQLLRLDPLQETMYLQLMRLQALQGDRTGAMHTYHTCATMLERNFRRPGGWRPSTGRTSSGCWGKPASARRIWPRNCSPGPANKGLPWCARARMPERDSWPMRLSSHGCAPNRCARRMLA